MSSLATIITTIEARLIRFTVVFFLVFTALYGVLYAVDFLPEPPAENTEPVVAESVTPAEREIMSDATDRPQSLSSEPEAVVTIETGKEDEVVFDSTPATVASTILPQSIYIERLDKTISVLNPTSRLIADLDNALLDGVVRHPDSAHLAQAGNVFILGHSSYLPNVFNPNFQAFNGIQDLAWGDVIEVTGEDDQIYVYRVEEVYEAKASEVIVPIAGDEKRLTIATCDSFGSTDDRFIVEASLVETRPAAG